MTDTSTATSEKGLRACIAIPTYNRGQVLIDTIEQVLALDPPADEVLVIDQTSDHDPEIASYLARTDKAGAIRWIRHQPAGLPGARNRAISETQCEVIIFIDDDVVLHRDFAAMHMRNYADPRVDAVAGRINQPEGYRYIYGTPPWPHLFDFLYFHLNGTERGEGLATFCGCNHSARVEALKAVGGYDENYIAWAFREDSDAAIRLWKGGRNIVFDPGTEITHLAIPGGGCRIKTEKKRIPEWHVSFPGCYFAWRHLFPGLSFWRQVTLQDIRKFVFRKDTVLHPWRLPVALGSYIYSFVRAAFLSVGSPASPFPVHADAAMRYKSGKERLEG